MHYATRAGEKLRKEGLTAHTLTVFAHNNPFREEDPQYSGSRVVPLVTPTQDTRKLIAAALAGLKDLYIPDINYKKAGVMLTDLVNQDVQQEDLFDVNDSDASKRLMQTIDVINQRQGRGTVYLSAEGGSHRSWQMQSKMRSPAYMSSWADIRTART